MDKGKLYLGAGLGGVMFAIALVAFLNPPEPMMILPPANAEKEDPLQGELARCRDISQPDAECTRVWIAHRVRFLGRDRSGQ